jgi:ABC-type lipoprotein export system ATPase subunit
VIRLENVTKTYRIGHEKKIQALFEINVTIQPGDFISVVGPSGSGKSTFLALAGLLERPNEGNVYFDEKEVAHLKDKLKAKIRAEKCGFVFQFPSLIPTLNALENVILPKTLDRTFTPKDLERGKELLLHVGLEDKVENLPYQMSGGEQRRVALARALINEPEYILADEPTGAVDEENANIIIDLFKDWNKAGKTIIMVTHDMKLAKQASRLIYIEKGKIIREE